MKTAAVRTNGTQKALRLNPDWAKLPLFDRSKWQQVRFGDVVENLNETCGPGGAGLERFIAMEHLEPGSLHIREWGSIADGTTFTRRCRPGQVLFGKRRAYQRKVAVAEFEAVVSGDIYVFAPKGERLLPELLPFLCISERFFNFAVETSAGSLSPRTNWSSLANFEFGLPPLTQQRRIAEVLWTMDEIRSAYEKLRQDGENVRRNLLRLTFADQTKYPRRLVKEAGSVQLGRQRAPQYQTGKFSRPYLRVANVFDGYIDYSDVLEMDFDEKDFAKYRLSPGDILLNEGQSLELVGRCAMFNGAIEQCCFQKTLLRFIPRQDVLPQWALAYFQYCLYFGVFASIALKTTSVAHLTAVRFEAMEMPIPSIDVQERFVSEYQTLQDVASVWNAHFVAINHLRDGLVNAMS